ncbi:MAG: M20/M25/M40 family metallo-hydrolase [Gemmatimonadaceae bacterium]|nr:M20/M25/M40 family metallo-hydrolase [Chitinophagaceae bacterium]
MSQKLKKADKVVIASLQGHVNFLASDKLEGRRAGSKGEMLAADYISARFKEIGLVPKGDKNGWLQAFDISEGLEMSKSSFLFLNGEELKTGEYFAFGGAPAKAIEAAPSIALRESGVPWFLDLKEDLDSNKNNPHFDLRAAVIAHARDAAKKGATAFIIYNTGIVADNLKFDPREKSNESGIPIIYVSGKPARKYFSDEEAAVDIKLKMVSAEKKRPGHNVLGYLDNGAANTVIIGAHFDHLGYGEDNNSMYRGTEKLIHNGADDNASGTAAMIELARMLKVSGLKKNNYLFIAFSGEELGLFGSKYFTEHPTIDLAKTNYMINMDMVGRLNDSSKAITIGGYGTSPAWGKIFTPASKKALLVNKYDSSGSGPSDHTSFYRKDIPVLFFFTGTHTDYHKPGDDAEKINYTGQFHIVRYIYSVIEKADPMGKLAFTKTRETQMAGSQRFSVSLGIMPDYTFTGEGVRADGVSEGRAAQKAGILTGDIIIQLGEHTINSMDTYMQALGKFKKSDKTIVKFRRGKEIKQAEVVF